MKIREINITTYTAMFGLNQRQVRFKEQPFTIRKMLEKYITIVILY
jgi:hypothetical protein